MHDFSIKLMKKYLITYDLKDANRNYNDLYNVIKDFGDVQHPLESTWVVKTDTYTANTISDMLLEKMDKYDSLFVIRVDSTVEHQGWLPKSFWEWFKS